MWMSTAPKYRCMQSIRMGTHRVGTLNDLISPEIKKHSPEINTVPGKHEWQLMTGRIYALAF
jgi:hypothetical protein